MRHLAPAPGSDILRCCGCSTNEVQSKFDSRLTHRMTYDRDAVDCPGQVRDAHVPGPDVDLAGVRIPGGEPWARTERVMNGARGRSAVLEQQIREDQQHQDALRVEAWASSLTKQQDRLIAAAAAEVIRGRR